MTIGLAFVAPVTLPVIESVLVSDVAPVGADGVTELIRFADSNVYSPFPSQSSFEIRQIELQQHVPAPISAPVTNPC